MEKGVNVKEFLQKNLYRLAGMAAVFVVIMCMSSHRVLADVPQESNMVYICATASDGSKVGANGVLLCMDNGERVVVTTAASVWSDAASLYMQGPQVARADVTLLGNDSESGLAVFHTDLSEGGCEQSSMLDMSQLMTGQAVYRCGMPISKVPDDENENLSDLVETNFALLIQSETIADYTFWTIEPGYDDDLVGGALINADGYLLGIMTPYNQEYKYMICMNDVVKVVNSYAQSKVGGNIGFGFGDLLLLLLIPVFFVTLIVSAIIYKGKRAKLQRKGIDEFENVMYLGGEIGLKILGKGGAFEGVRFPIEDKLVFGRDTSKCDIVFPDGELGEGISRLHCSIELKGGKMLLTDLGSSYGTYLANGKKLEANQPQEIKFSDEFYLAKPENVFRIV